MIPEPMVFYTPSPSPGPGILPSHVVAWRLAFDSFAHGVVRADYLRNAHGSCCSPPPRGAPLYASVRDAGLGRRPVAASNGPHATGVTMVAS